LSFSERELSGLPKNEAASRQIKRCHWQGIIPIFAGQTPVIELLMIALLLMTMLLSLGCASKPGPETSQQEADEWVKAHNRFRTQHNAPPVKWSERLASSAQKVADHCPSGHSKTSYGENLAWVSVPKPVSDVVRLWYGEVEKYDFSNPGFSPQIGHFTQVVWKGTTEIGCARNTGCSTRISNVWVCHYNPPGNYQGRFADNVLPKNGIRR
jgi:uncharacterized protein YkwD